MPPIHTTATTMTTTDDNNTLVPTALHLTIAAVLAFGVDPLCRQVWRKGHPNSKEGFRSTFVYGAVHSIAISAQVYLGLVATELFLHQGLLARVVPFASGLSHLQQAAPSIALSIWIGLSVATIKRVLLLQSVAGKKLGRVGLLDRFINLVIFVVVGLNVMDILDMDLSLGMQSILSAGGVGALVFSLASQDLAQGLVGGLAVQAWDAFAVGDIIILGDGTEGIVAEIGLVETHLKGYDGIVTRIPNSQLTTARVSNLSRVKRSRLLQKLRFHYRDLEKLPALLEEIKAEIIKSCPKVITDGSAGFFAVLEEYQEDHIGGLVIANFEIPPRTADFIQNRQEFMLAIARAMKKHHIDFAVPIIEYKGAFGSIPTHDALANGRDKK